MLYYHRKEQKIAPKGQEIRGIVIKTDFEKNVC